MPRRREVVESIAALDFESSLSDYRTEVTKALSGALEGNPTVEAADKESIAVSPAKEEIEILEKNGKRIYEFVVNPVGSIPQGTYIVRATLKINEKVYDSEIALRIN